MTIKNYTFGARAPDLEEAVSDAIFAAHKYRNQLCQLELEKRERHENLLRKLAPSYVSACIYVETAEEELGQCREIIQRERAKQRTRSPSGCDAQVSRAKELRAKLKVLRAARKEKKQAAYLCTAVKLAMDANQARHKAECRDAKKDSGLYWPTEAIVRAAASSMSSGAPPKFQRFAGEGQLAMQLQQGLSTTRAMVGDTRVWIDAPESLQRIHAERGKATRRESRCHAFFRIGSDGREPIFARVPIVLHRPLPSGKIKWAYLERRKQADQNRWKLRLTIDTVDPPPREKTTWVAVHYGWSMQKSGLRVAIWRGSDGESGALVLSTARHLADYARLDTVRSKRDKEFDAIKEDFADWLASHKDIPEWLTEATAHLGKWKSQARLVVLLCRWRDARFDDDDIFAALDAWRKGDKHLWQHERRLAVRVARRRKDQYRVFAKQLSDRYGILYHAKIPIKILTSNSEPEQMEKDKHAVHRRASWASIGDLTRLVEEKFPLSAIAVDTKNLSKQCSNCGEVAQENKVKVQCAGCGRTWLSDENALVNTIARGKVAQKNGALSDLVTAKQDAAEKAAVRMAKMQDGNRAARKRANKTIEPLVL